MRERGSDDNAFKARSVCSMGGIVHPLPKEGGGEGGRVSGREAGRKGRRRGGREGEEGGREAEGCEIHDANAWTPRVRSVVHGDTCSDGRAQPN